MRSREDTNDDGDQAYKLVQHPSYIPHESSKLSNIIVDQTPVV